VLLVVIFRCLMSNNLHDPPGSMGLPQSMLSFISTISMGQPRVTCAQPCKLQIPPWPSATSTVDYPLVTASQRSWASTITQPPITVSEWVYDPITVTQAAGINKRDTTTRVKPRLAETPFWPAFVYYGGEDGKPATTSATIPFPTSAARIDPDTSPSPPSGHWAREVQLEVSFYWDQWGTDNPGHHQSFNPGPFVAPCTYPAFNNATGPGCVKQPWSGWSTNPGFIGINDVENAVDMAFCPLIPESSTTSFASASATATPTESSTGRPVNTGDPRDNSVSCFSTWFSEATEQQRMFTAAGHFCDQLEGQDMGPGFQSFQTYTYPYNRGIGIVAIDVSLEVKPDCNSDANEPRRTIKWGRLKSPASYPMSLTSPIH